MTRRAYVFVVDAAVALLVAAFVLMVLYGCSGIKVAGECTYTRTVETTYTCAPGGTVEHVRVAPVNPEP